MRILKALNRSEAGTAVVELAVALPMLMIVALGITDFVSAFGQKMALQQQAQAGANYIAAHYFTKPTVEDVKKEVIATSGLDQSQITVGQWTECNQAKVAQFDECPGESDIKVSFMKITITDTYDPMLAIDGFADFVGKTNVKASVVVRLP